MADEHGTCIKQTVGKFENEIGIWNGIVFEFRRAWKLDKKKKLKVNDKI